jgi:tetratricopeptide (TPR) repeat protein
MICSRILYCLIAFLILSPEITAQVVDNTKPMYGEVPKNREHLQADEEFRRECLSQFKTIDSAVKVQLNRAWSYFYEKDVKTSMKRFNQAWLLNPEYPDPYFGFAALLEMEGNKKGAERFYQLGLSKDPKNERAVLCYRTIADCKEQFKDLQGVIDAYTKITVIDPVNALAFKKIGYFQMRIRNSDEALAAYAKAIELDPKDPLTFNNRAFLYQKMKNYKDAMTDYSKAIELNPKYISAYVNRGVAEMEQNDNSSAKKDFETCVQIDQKDGSLRRLLGFAKLNLKDNIGACQDFELAKQLGDPQAEEVIKTNCK